MLKLIALISALASAQVKVDNVIAVNSPRGIRVISVPERTERLDAPELVRRYTDFTSPFEFRRAFRQVGDLISEPNLYSRFRAESDLALVKFVRLAVELLRLKGVTLDLEHGTAVGYESEPVHQPGRTTPGMIDGCWECYGAEGNREYVASHLGLEAGSLENKVSLNPRFAARQLFRGSAAVFKLHFNTNERGVVDVPLILELDESYQPFVADVPSPGGLFGKRVYGVAQRVRMTGTVKLDPAIFGVDGVEFTEFDLFNVGKDDAKLTLPSIFEDVRDRAVPNRPRQGYLRQAIKDVITFARDNTFITRDRLLLPGAPSWLEAW